MLVCAGLGLAVAHAGEPNAATTERSGAVFARESDPAQGSDLMRAVPAMDLRAGPASARGPLSADAAEPAMPAPSRFKPAASGISLIELPPEYSPRGPQRKHHALGFRSYAAENWLKEQGVNAHNCMLPMLRLHTRVTPDGTASGTFWVYARCSLR